MSQSVKKSIIIPNSKKAPTSPIQQQIPQDYLHTPNINQKTTTQSQHREQNSRSSHQTRSRSTNPRTSQTSKNNESRSTLETSSLFNNQLDLPLLYQCKACSFILTNSHQALQRLSFPGMPELLTFHRKESNLKIKDENDVMIVQEGEYDQFCVFNPVTCINCSTKIGKFYISTSEQVDQLKNQIAIPENSLKIYDIDQSTLVANSHPKQQKLSNPSSPALVKLKNQQTTITKDQNQKLYSMAYIDDKNPFASPDQPFEQRFQEEQQQQYGDEVVSQRDSEMSGEKVLKQENRQPQWESMLSESNSIGRMKQDVQEEQKLAERVMNGSMQSDQGNENDGRVANQVQMDFEKQIQVQSQRDEKDVKRVDQAFKEMKEIMGNFAQLLEQFDLRLTNNENQMQVSHETLKNLFEQLQVEKRDLK